MGLAIALIAREHLLPIPSWGSVWEGSIMAVCARVHVRGSKMIAIRMVAREEITLVLIPASAGRGLIKAVNATASVEKLTGSVVMMSVRGRTESAKGGSTLAVSAMTNRHCGMAFAR